MDEPCGDQHEHEHPANRRILVAGASIRAASESIRRAGYVPWGVDLFADLDQIACGPTIRIERYPHDLAEAWKRLPPSPWIFSGGLENHPKLLGRLAQVGRLLGIDAASVRRVRDPWELDRVLSAAGFPLPEFREDSPPAANPADWLWKPLRSAGGLGIRRAAGGVGNSAGYFQRFVPGEVLGATFLGSSDGVRLAGVTRQLAGPDWGEAPGFAYGGSVGPLAFEPSRAHQLETLGRALHEHFQLVGLFGVDLIDDGRQFWPLEVNPRYTASVEVLELTTGHSWMAEHVAACQRRSRATLDRASVGSPTELPTVGSPMLGKAIVYAKKSFVVTAARAQSFDELNQLRPLRSAADLPAPGSTIPAGAPVLTVFASGASLESIRAALRERIAQCREY